MSTEKNTDWTWLQNTYWYVPTPGLPALQLDSDKNQLAWLRDQTLWHIAGCKNGYVWGVASVMMHGEHESIPAHGPRSSPVHLGLLGTVTAGGQVHLTFVPSRGLSSTTNGFGQLVRVEGAWAFEMQMATDRMGALVLHWATMLQTRKGEESWNKLPGLPYSVPEMLEGAVYPGIK